MPTSPNDICYASKGMHESGADGINLDTVGAAGDADFQASLLATEKLRAQYPDICIELGMAGEFILGIEINCVQRFEDKIHH